MKQKERKRKIILYSGAAVMALIIVGLLIADGRALFSPRYNPDPDYIAGSDWARQEIVTKDTSKMSADPLANLFSQLYQWTGTIVKMSGNPFDALESGKENTETETASTAEELQTEESVGTEEVQ